MKGAGFRRQTPADRFSVPGFRFSCPVTRYRLTTHDARLTTRPAVHCAADMKQPAEPESPSARAVSWRRNLYAITIAQALAIIGFSLREPILPFYLKDLGAVSTDSATRWSGLFAAGGGLTMAVTAPLWGLIGDRFGRKPMLLRSMIAASITVGLMGLAVEPWHIVGLRLVEGAFTGTVTASTALVATSAPRERLGFNLGMVQTAVFAGSALGPSIGGFTGAQFGYRATFFVSAALLMSAVVIVIFFVREVFTRQARVDARLAETGNRWAWVLGGVVLAMLATLFAVRAVQMGIRPVMPLFLQELGGYSDDRAATVSGWMFGVLGVSSAVSAIIFGRRGDKVGHERILLGCVIGSGILYIPMAIAQSAWQLIALQGLFGIAAGGMIPSANAIIANITPPERRGLTYGVTATAGGLGAAFGPLLLSSLIAPLFGFEVAFVTVGVLLLALGAFLWRVVRTQVPEATVMESIFIAPGRGD
jgi:DHA1 family multidrug resistance protein-like MFS transporter